ncbi:restriction endonuclease subunit S [Escherichia coli]|uniref:restriction endonuclease subunit S n=1 Tax=Escherichia coli TaxID=562 RepID=UPI0017692C15|nr:restriction endonuclease subunit S [Escherichia coli]EEW0701450.1 type I restriction endonuclease subunit S [Escherichia coli]EHO0059800.1 restriction endonuclease subunit S [Escherichia coli]EID6939135.1 restriction endonuclease subunit S [Escherichia coli]EIJ1666018.1 restriction endonuclease subunit S [Escherichia coli]EKF1147331.1 restriction endonuclease subunit S [Escherichia coli]
MVAIPQQWLAIQLGDVVPYGKTEKCELSDVTGDTWILELEDIEKDSSKIIQRLDATARPFKSTKNKFSKGDVLYGKLRPYLNKVVIADNSGVCSTEIIPLNAEPYIDNRYLFYWLKSEIFLNFVNSVSYGVNMPRLGTKDGLVAPFILAPLSEQKVIADKLGAHLAKVETIKSRLETIPEILKNFRQSILSAAVCGTLTGEWREENHFIPSIPNKGKEKFKTDLFEAATQSLPELPKEWIVVPAANILEYVTSGSRGWAKYYADEGALFLRMSNVRYDTTKLDLNNLQYVNLPENTEGKRSLVRKNDLVISITADVGRVARIDVELEEAYINQHLALVRPSKFINAEYLATCIAAVNIGVKQIQSLKRGATKAGLSLDDIRSLAIPFPSIEEQTEIVCRVEKMFAFADRIEQRVKSALERVNKFSQTILAKAFRGELTAEWRAANLDLISGDNSAKALLKKIKAEHEAIKRQPKPKPTAVKKKTGNNMSKQIIKVVEVLKEASAPLSGQQLLAAAGYPSDCNTEQLEQFFLDIRNALTIENSIVKLQRDEDGQDWFTLAEKAPTNKAKN